MVVAKDLAVGLSKCRVFERYMPWTQAWLKYPQCYYVCARNTQPKAKVSVHLLAPVMNNFHLKPNMFNSFTKKQSEL